MDSDSLSHMWVVVWVFLFVFFGGVFLEFSQETKLAYSKWCVWLANGGSKARSQNSEYTFKFSTPAFNMVVLGYGE